MSGRFRHRIERAARDLNPYLVLLVIGLTLLNVIGLALRLPHVTLARGVSAGTCAPAHAAGDLVSGSDAALRAGS
ncbi:MAG: hypothetical protein JO162_13525 [Alphaproteobacteria bacterium]|nr:hypothetical protein [Alphaproteobacteria bacterium]MBV9015826.1 hypothetical protein [Alphaproteobacteria bacterium]